MHNSRRFKDRVFALLAQVGKAVASPVRMELLDFLCQRPYTVEELAILIHQSVANTSQHLQSLQQSRIVAGKRRGRFMQYCLAGPEVGDFVRAVRLLAESRSPELLQAQQKLLAEIHLAEPVRRPELLRRVKAGKALVIDVRPPEEYAAGHLKGAVSLPLKELQTRLRSLPRNRQIVAYCRGPYCILAVEAVRVLQAKGFRAKWLDMGVVDFRAAGLSVVHTR